MLPNRNQGDWLQSWPSSWPCYVLSHCKVTLQLLPLTGECISLLLQSGLALYTKTWQKRGASISGIGLRPFTCQTLQLRSLPLSYRETIWKDLHCPGREHYQWPDSHEPTPQIRDRSQSMSTEWLTQHGTHLRHTAWFIWDEKNHSAEPKTCTQ